MNPTKVCTKCNTRRYFYHFQFRKDTGKYRNICKICRSKQESDRRATGTVPKYKPTKEQNKKYNLKQLYGLTMEVYNQMLTNQDGKCAICGGSDRLVVDHCHETEDVRGLLCQHCNFMLGNAKDNIDILKAGIEYLSSPLPKSDV